MVTVHITLIVALIFFVALAGFGLGGVVAIRILKRSGVIESR